MTAGANSGTGNNAEATDTTDRAAIDIESGNANRDEQQREPQFGDQSSRLSKPKIISVSIPCSVVCSWPYRY